MDWFKYDFGYEWPWTYGHLIPIVLFGLLAWVAVKRKWPTWCVVLLCLPAVWGVVGLWIVHAVMNINRPPKLPTSQFLEPGNGVVLDAGAGSGRSSLMVLLERPRSKVIALDIFSNDYGIGDNTPERLMRNATIAGVAARVEVKNGDMREIPLDTNSLDAAVSAFAIDHLPRDGVIRALSELRRTLKPGGQFLLLTLNPDRYVRIAYPLAAEHGYFGPRDPLTRWSGELSTAGFEVTEAGTTPGTLYLLCASRD